MVLLLGLLLRFDSGHLLLHSDDVLGEFCVSYFMFGYQIVVFLPNLHLFGQLLQFLFQEVVLGLHSRQYVLKFSHCQLHLLFLHLQGVYQFKALLLFGNRVHQSVLAFLLQLLRQLVNLSL